MMSAGLQITHFTSLSNRLIIREGSSCVTDGAPHPSNSCQYCRNGDWHNRTDYRPIFTEVGATINFPIILIPGLLISPGYWLAAKIDFIYNFIVENCNGQSVGRF